MNTDYKSGDFLLKGQNIQHTALKIKHCPSEFHRDGIIEDTNSTYCTPLISPNLPAKNINMHQLRPFK